GAYDIEVVCQKDQTLEIEGDDNILPLITTEVSNNVLHIRSLRSHSTDDKIRLKITVPDLEGVSGSGAGRINVSGLKNEQFEVDVNGAPTITAAGETKLLKVNTNGAAKIDTHKLRASQAVVESNGVSQVEVFAADKLDVTISGPSHVIYRGDPEVNQTINGPGKLEKRESEGA
ncbi:MAG: head GIN domain-containing protein, partial [Pyrinomonadaceae bacterium]